MRGTGFAAWANIPVTKTGLYNESAADLLNPTKARRTPTEQRTKPIKARGLKKSDRETDFFHIFHRTSSCARKPCRSRLDSFNYAGERQA